MFAMEPAQAPQVDTGQTRVGDIDEKVMLEGKQGTPGNYRLLLEEPITDWITPRHRHDFDQVRFAMKGDLDYAPGKVLPEGWVAYFPEGVYYGPQVKKTGISLALFQFGGASGHGYSSNKQKKAAYDAMLAEGKFENGVFTYVDQEGKTHNQDAAEARRERIIGKKVEYKPRYDEIVIMNPANYDWLPHPKAAQVECKWLGCFTEREIRIGFIRLAADARVDFGLHGAPEMVLVSRGAVRLDNLNRAYGANSALSFEKNEGPIPVTAAEPSELFVVQLPKF